MHAFALTPVPGPVYTHTWPSAAHAGNLCTLAVAPDGCALLAVGHDEAGRRLLALFDTSKALRGGEVRGAAAPQSVRH